MPAFLLSPLFRYAMLALALIAALFGIWLHGRSAGIKSMEPKVAEAQSAAELWRKTAENRLTLMKAQNDAVEGLKQAHETRLGLLRAKLAKAEAETEKARRVAEKRATDLKNMELSGTECEMLVQLVDEARK